MEVLFFLFIAFCPYRRAEGLRRQAAMLLHKAKKPNHQGGKKNPLHHFASLPHPPPFSHNPSFGKTTHKAKRRKRGGFDSPILAIPRNLEREKREKEDEESTACVVLVPLFSSSSLLSPLLPLLLPTSHRNERKGRREIPSEGEEEEEKRGRGNALHQRKERGRRKGISPPPPISENILSF